MAERFIQVVYSNPAEGKTDAEFNEWYDNVHVPQLLEIPGMLSARRYDLHDAEIYRFPGGFVPEHRYMCVYEMEGDVNAIMEKVVAGVTDGRIDMGSCLDLPGSRMSFWRPRGEKVGA
ncbi:hypothetical protein A5776_17405 [Mycolicibacterium elephantis]|uniref:DUF4286 family protein n=1 Tax=Mycolicibacterium elephantis TaxID=81858 RepID=UPI000629063D|nr:DUF4286 family protein [Mycolicibacterium elephantis]KKW66472.1 hypothetical protein AAV95_01475 [Mycolicibacterium elephantis]OBE97442.1 hypothetical protein A5776_17405 [Mycolicibacterium elephantis]